MKSIVVLLLYWTLSVQGEFFQNRKILVSKISNSNLIVNSIEQVQKRIRDETYLNLHSLSSSVKEDLLRLAENAFRNSAFPVKTPTGFMQVQLTGERESYENQYREHRLRLSFLVVGELLLEQQVTRHDNKSYIDEIVNGVWMMLEDSAWCYPDHLGLQGATGALPVPGHVALDLNAGETAKLLAWIKLMLGSRFDQISPVINQRIDHELRNRVFQDYLDKHYWWQSFDVDHDAVNWNVWINSNVLKAALFTLKDGSLFEKVLNKTIYSVDYFLDNYPNDGGCIEGPFYWRHAGGRLIEYLESLEHIFGTEMHTYFSGIDLIKQMGEYSMKMRIAQNWFVNFGDSYPQLTYPPSVLAKYGTLFDDMNMKQFAAYMIQYVGNVSQASTYFGRLLAKDDIRELVNLDLNEFFNVVNMRGQIEEMMMNEQSAVGPEFDLVWLPDIQVMTARADKGTKGKLFLGAKAGHNNESHHNHNDVGHFILFQDGTPVLIDIGVGAY